MDESDIDPNGVAPTASMGGSPLTTGDPYRVDITDTRVFRRSHSRASSPTRLSDQRLLRGDAFSVFVT
ncbi:MAG: hypothetical protein IJ887_05685 [Prevotella sp.]|nr:hypothetical protein [Prevotella sp.]MBR6187796.1 hypothetical protein [Prevotella sp.]